MLLYNLTKGRICRQCTFEKAWYDEKKDYENSTQTEVEKNQMYEEA